MVTKTLFKTANLLFTLIYLWSFYTDYELTKIYRILPVPGLYYSKLVWLTIVNLCLQQLYHAVGAILAMFDVRKTSILHPFHFVATTLAFPVSMTVVLLFWGLVYLDPNFLVKEENAFLFEHKFFNHSIHTFPLLAMLVDFSIWNHSRPSRRGAFIAVAIFTAAYLIDIHYFYYTHGFWAYPILGQLAPWSRVLFFVFCSIFIFCTFIAGDLVNGWIHAMWRHKKREGRKGKRNAKKVA